MRRRSVVLEFVEQRSSRIEQLYMQRRYSCCMSRATQAGIIGAHDGRDSIEHALAKFRAVDEVLGDLFDTASDREVIVPCGNNQVGPGDRTFLVYLVVVD